MKTRFSITLIQTTCLVNDEKILFLRYKRVLFTEKSLNFFQSKPLLTYTSKANSDSGFVANKSTFCDIFSVVIKLFSATDKNLLIWYMALALSNGSLITKVDYHTVYK